MVKRVSLRLTEEHAQMLKELQEYYDLSTNGVFNYTESDILRLAIFLLHKEMPKVKTEETEEKDK